MGANAKEKPARTIKSNYIIKSLSDSIAIVELMANSRVELSINDIASTLKLTKQNCANMLHTLCMHRAVEKNNATGKYRLGVSLFQVSTAYLNKIDIISVAEKELEFLRNEFNETALLGLLRKGTLVYVKYFETTKPVRVVPAIANLRPAYATAAGKAMLAYRGFDYVDAYYSFFEKITDNTITNIDKLKEELRIIKERNYAVDDREYRIDVRCVASPILNFLGKPIGAISITAPVNRMSLERIHEEIAPVLVKVCDELSHRCGYTKKYKTSSNDNTSPTA